MRSVCNPEKQLAVYLKLHLLGSKRVSEATKGSIPAKQKHAWMSTDCPEAMRPSGVNRASKN
jgi:hypothetical protein